MGSCRRVWGGSDGETLSMRLCHPMSFLLSSSFLLDRRMRWTVHGGSAGRDNPWRGAEQALLIQASLEK